MVSVVGMFNVEHIIIKRAFYSKKLRHYEIIIKISIALYGFIVSRETFRFLESSI